MCVCPSPYVVGLGDTHGGPLRQMCPGGQDQEESGHMRPVQPGWVAVPAVKSEVIPNEWYHVVGWTEGEVIEPVIATETGITPWHIEFGEDPYCIATLEEWTGAQHGDGTSHV